MRQRGFPAGGEEDNLCAGGCQGCGGNQVVAGSAQQVQAVGSDGLSIGKDAADRGGAGFLGAAKGFVFQGGDASFFVAGGRVLVNGLVVGCEIVFKIVYKVYGLMENFFVFTAVHEERFRTEHFGNLGEDGRSAFGDEKVGKNTDGGIGGDARQAVGTAAFHADNQFAAGNGFALCCAGVVGQLLYQARPSAISSSESWATRNLTRSGL